MQPLIQLLKSQDIDLIHQSSLEILERSGVVFKNREALEVFRRHGAGVDGSRVRLPSKMVDQCLSSAPEKFVLKARNPARDVEIGGPAAACAPAAGCVFIMESGGLRRAATSRDYINLVKLIHGSPSLGLNGGGVVMPGDLKNEEKFAFMMLAALVLTDKPVMGFTLGGESSRHTLEMVDIAFGGSGGCQVMGTVNPDSPLVYDEGMIEGLMLFASRGQPVVIAPCSMAMATSPATCAGTLVLNNAEVLAGIVLAQLINPGTPVVYGNTSTISDMRTMNIALGAPELSILSSAAAQMARCYGLPSRVGGALTDAKAVDVAAGYQSMMSMYTTMASGASVVIHACGILDSFLTVSLEKFIVDEEITGMVVRFLRGMEVSPAAIGLETIIGVGPGSHFLDTDHTMEYFRKEFWQPVISDRHSFREGTDYSADMLNKARTQWEKRIGEYRRPDIDPGMEKDLIKYFVNSFGWSPFLQ